MDSPALTFAPQEGRRAPSMPAQTDLAWRFNPSLGLDLPFHGLLSHFGLDLIMDLDEIVLDTPKGAAIRATRLYKSYSARLGGEDQTREVMQHMANTLRPALGAAEDYPLVPPQAVFHGRPKG